MAHEPPGAPDDDGPLILDELRDRLDRFRLLRDTDDVSSDRILAELGGSGRVELDMVTELATARPLAHPERFAEAHMVAMTRSRSSPATARGRPASCGSAC